MAYWDMCNDLSKANLLAMTFKSPMYPSAKSPGILRFSQAHDDARGLEAARRLHYEEGTIGQLTRKDY